MNQNRHGRFYPYLLAAGMLLSLNQCSTASKKTIINEAEFRDRVNAGWLGKNIGGTLGMPFEGKTEPNDISFYTKIDAGNPAANDDPDLQILWLKAMEENNCRIDAYSNRCRICGRNQRCRQNSGYAIGFHYVEC